MPFVGSTNGIYDVYYLEDIRLETICYQKMPIKGRISKRSWPLHFGYVYLRR